MRPSEVRITIDEIVLDGVDVADVDAFRAALAGTLTGLAAAHRGGYPAQVAAQLRGTSVVVPARPAGEGLGAHVARSVWASTVPAAVPGGDTPDGGGRP